MTDLILVANSKDGTVDAFDYAEGALRHLATTTLAPGLPLATDDARGLVYAGTKGADAGGTGAGPSIVTLRVNRATGELTPVSTAPARGAATSLALTSDGTRLLSACYHEGVGEAWTVDESGALTPAPDVVEFRNLHCVITSADDRFAYFVSLGQDLVAQYALGDDGSLTPLERPTLDLPAGVGARHLTLDSAGTNVYLVTEFTAQVFWFTRDAATGALAEAGSVVAHPDDRGLAVSRFGADPRAEHLIWGADVRLSPDGSLLYASERTEATITAVPIGPDGRPGAASAHSEVVAQPRFFRVLDDGRLLVASEIGAEIGLYDADDAGALTQVCAVPVGQGANWISVIPR